MSNTEWLDKALKYFSYHSPSGYWKELSDKINTVNPASFYGLINDHLESKTFLNGHELSPEDFYLAATLMKSPSWNKLIASKTRPFHMCRWFMHIFSIYPDNDFKFHRITYEKIDGRLAKALQENNMKLFYILLDLVDINAKSPNNKGAKAIHIAASMGNIEALEKILSLGVNIEAEDEEGLTPVFYAAQSESLDALNYLKNKGANVFHIEKQGRSLFYWAASLGKIEMLDILIENGLDPNKTTILGRTALSKSAWNGNVEILKYLLKVPGINIEVPDNRGRTALHNAVWGSVGGREGKKMGQNAKDSPECAKLLLDGGCNMEAMDNRENTPLSIACATHSPKSVRLLLKYNANIYHKGRGYSPYHQALRRGNIKCAQIMIDSGVDINSIGRTYRPIQLSLKYLQKESLKWLISKNIMPNEEDFLLCIKFSDSIMLELLLQYINIENLSEIIMKEGNLECANWAAKNIKQNDKSVAAAIKKDKKLGEALLKTWEGRITSEILEAMIESKIDSSLYLHRAIPTGCILRLSIKQGNLALSESILASNPDLCLDIDSFSGNTALHISCISGLSDLIPRLISLVPDPIAYITKPNAKGLTPIILAQLHKHLYISEMLKDMIDQSSDSKTLTQVIALEYEENSEELTSHPYANNMPLGYWHSKSSFTSINDTPCIWIDTIEGLLNMQESIKGANVIGVDLEYHSFQNKKGCLCLVQISTGYVDYIIDALANRNELGIMIKRIMADQDVIKIFHGPDSDLLWLQNDFDAHPVRIFDTARAYKIINGNPQLPSLAALLKTYFNLTIDKTFQVAEWRIRPIPIAMINYARSDAHYLPALYNKLLDQLNSEQLISLNNQCNGMCLKSPKGKLDRIKIKCK